MNRIGNNTKLQLTTETSLTLEHPGGSNRPPIGFSNLKIEALIEAITMKLSELVVC